MDDTPNLQLPYILAAQAQKHVTHNEAIRALDAVVQLAVLDRHLATPPGSPADGDRYIVGASATDAWAGQDGVIAAWQDGAWAFYAPGEGWLAWIADEDILVAWNGTSWVATGSGGGGGGGGINNLVEDATPQLGGALDGQGFDLNNLGVVFMSEQAAAEADVAGKGQFWVKTATPNVPMFTDDAGNDLAVLTDNLIGSSVQAWDAVLDATTAPFQTADETKLDFITITQAVDLDQIETRVNELDAAVVLQGSWDASSGSFPGSGSAQAGHSYIVSVGGTVDGVVFTANDRIVALADNASTSTYASNWLKLDYTDQVLSVAGKTGGVVLAATDIASGTLDNARIAESNVTQHEGAIDHDALTNFVANEHVDHSNVSMTVAGTTGEIASSAGAQDISASRTWTIGLADNAQMPGTEGINVSGGTTAERPGAPVEGDLRKNTSTKVIEYYDGTGWVNLTAGAAGGIGNVVEDATPELGGALSCADQQIIRAMFKDYSELVVDHGITGSSETIDIEGGNVHVAVIDQACTWTFSNPIASDDNTSFTLILHGGTIGSQTWPTAVFWPGGTPPTLIDNTFTFTTTNATNTINATAHGLLDGERIQMTTSGADLPNGYTIGTVYFVVNKSANAFQVSLTAGGAAVSIADDGSGTHTAHWGTDVLTFTTVNGGVQWLGFHAGEDMQI